eukprot:gene12135-8679_t
MEESSTGSWQLSDNSSRIIGGQDSGDSSWEASEESKESEYVFTIDMDGDQGDGSLERDGNDGSRDWEAYDEDTYDRVDGIGGDTDGFSDEMVDDYDVHHDVLSDES